MITSANTVMTIEALEVLMLDQDAFKKAFRKVEKGVFSTDVRPKNSLVGLLKDKFVAGRAPYIHQVILPNGSQIRLKFTNTIKKILNSKGKEVPGKESYLSYAEVTVAPVGVKAYCYTTDLNQIVWGVSPSKATTKHTSCLNNLIQDAADLGINLNPAEAWNTIYSENY